MPGPGGGIGRFARRKTENGAVPPNNNNPNDTITDNTKEDAAPKEDDLNVNAFALSTTVPCLDDATLTENDFESTMGQFDMNNTSMDMDMGIANDFMASAALAHSDDGNNNTLCCDWMGGDSGSNIFHTQTENPSSLSNNVQQDDSETFEMPSIKTQEEMVERNIPLADTMKETDHTLCNQANSNPNPNTNTNDAERNNVTALQDQTFSTTDDGDTQHETIMSPKKQENTSSIQQNWNETTIAQKEGDESNLNETFNDRNENENENEHENKNDDIAAPDSQPNTNNTLDKDLLNHSSTDETTNMDEKQHMDSISSSFDNEKEKELPNTNENVLVDSISLVRKHSNETESVMTTGMASTIHPKQQQAITEKHDDIFVTNHHHELQMLGNCLTRESNPRDDGHDMDSHSNHNPHEELLVKTNEESIHVRNSYETKDPNVNPKDSTPDNSLKTRNPIMTETTNTTVHDRKEDTNESMPDLTSKINDSPEANIGKELPCTTSTAPSPIVTEKTTTTTLDIRKEGINNSISSLSMETKSCLNPDRSMDKIENNSFYEKPRGNICVLNLSKPASINIDLNGEKEEHNGASNRSPNINAKYNDIASHMERKERISIQAKHPIISSKTQQSSEDELSKHSKDDFKKMQFASKASNAIAESQIDSKQSNIDLSSKPAASNPVFPDSSQDFPMDDVGPGTANIASKILPKRTRKRSHTNIVLPPENIQNRMTVGKHIQRMKHANAEPAKKENMFPIAQDPNVHNTPREQNRNETTEFLYKKAQDCQPKRVARKTMHNDASEISMGDGSKAHDVNSLGQTDSSGIYCDLLDVSLKSSYVKSTQPEKRIVFNESENKTMNHFSAALSKSAKPLFLEESLRGDSFDDLLSRFLSDLRDGSDIYEKGSTNLLGLEVELAQSHSTALRYLGHVMDLREEVDELERMTRDAICQIDDTV